MLNKFLSIFLILFLFITFFNICYARDTLLMDLNNINAVSNEIVDDTIYSPETSSGNEILPNIENSVDDEITSGTQDTSSDISVSTDYDVSSSSELSISNIINIFLIVVGIVLVFLGIAIIIKLK